MNDNKVNNLRYILLHGNNEIKHCFITIALISQSGGKQARGIPCLVDSLYLRESHSELTLNGISHTPVRESVIHVCRGWGPAYVQKHSIDRWISYHYEKLLIDFISCDL